MKAIIFAMVQLTAIIIFERQQRALMEPFSTDAVVTQPLGDPPTAAW